MRLFADDQLHNFHDAFARHLAAIKPSEDWQTHRAGDAKAQGQLAFEVLKKVNDVVTDKPRLATTINRLLDNYNALNQGQSVHQLCSSVDDQTHLVVGFWHSGADELFETILSFLDLQAENFTPLMIHEGVPSYGHCIPSEQTSNRKLLTMEVAQYTYWLQDVWPTGKPIVQKRQAYAHNLKRIETLFGEPVHWWFTLRDATESIVALLNELKLNPLDHRGYPIAWNLAYERFGKQLDRPWQELPNYVKAYDFWAYYHQDLMLNLAQLTQATLVTYAQLNQLCELTLPLPLPNIDVNTAAQETPGWFDVTLHNQAIDRVLEVTNDKTGSIIDAFRR